MRVKLTIKNYRCFIQPATIELGKGFTAFVGVNNAGKSAAMRFLIELRNLFKSIAANHNFARSLTRDQFSTGISLIHVTDPEEIFSNRNNEPISFWLDFTFEEGDPIPDRDICPTRVLFIFKRDLTWQTQLYFSDTQKHFAGVPSHGNNNIYHHGDVRFNATPLFETTNILSHTLYVGPFRNTINIGTKEDYFDIKIGQSFITQFRELKTGASKKSSSEISNVSESIRRIFGFDSLDIIPSVDNTSLHITINGRPYKQHELGSGIAQFIVVLANASIAKPSILLIDEPELNLHPSLQLDFLTTLSSYVKEGVWFSTHSLGLARSSAERVYSVSRVQDGDSVVRPLEGTPRLSEFLGEMNFGSYKELGFDKILLVEGPTEVKVLQQFLRAIRKEHKHVILPMHGSWPEKAELAEIMRITPHVAALIDSERDIENGPIEGRREAFLRLCQENNIAAHALHLRATENYFTDRAVKEVFGNSHRSLGPFERLRDAKPNWSKGQNWKLAAAMSFDEIKDSDLGKFLLAL